MVYEVLDHQFSITIQIDFFHEEVINFTRCYFWSYTDEL